MLVGLQVFKLIIVIDQVPDDRVVRGKWLAERLGFVIQDSF